MEVIITIIPIFIIIILGWGARKKGFITPNFWGRQTGWSIFYLFRQ